MRPIKLELAGLQSFQEKQIIDFDYLTEYGLFGIFGSTGSGKSTILDAITLALYGEVIRIKGIKQDTLDNLININSKEIYVRFSFKIADNYYDIERSFKCKRNERLIGTKKVVMRKNNDLIADKIVEINLEVFKIIGLNAEDFNRSVILPQGKFSDFLKLSGSERRTMLERLFNLESYGRSLTKKVKDKKNKYLELINAIDNQIKGKGNVEAESFELLEEEESELQISCNSLKQEIEEVKDILKEQEEVIKLQEELKENKDFLDKLEAQIDDINKFKDVIKNREIALDLYKKYQEFQEDSKLYQEKLELQEKLLPEKKELDIKVFELLKSIEELKTNRKKLAEEYSSNKLNSVELDRYNNLLNLLEQYRKEEELFKNIELNINELKITHKKLKEEIKSMEKQKEEYNIQEKSINLIEEKEIFSIEKSILKLDLEISQVKNLKEQISQKEQLLNKAIENKEKLQKEIGLLEKNQGIYNKALASHLATTLKEGEACIVCGSTSHPNKANIEYNSKVEDSYKLMDLKAQLRLVSIEQYEEEVKNLELQLQGRDYKKLIHTKEEMEAQVKTLKVLQEDSLDKKIKINIEQERLERDIHELNFKIQGTVDILTLKESEFQSKINEISKIKESFKKLDKDYIQEELILEDKVQNYLDEILVRRSLSERLELDLEKVEEDLESLQEDYSFYNEKLQFINEKINSTSGELIHLERIKNKSNSELMLLLNNSIFDTIEAVEKAIIDEEEDRNLRFKIKDFEEKKEKHTISIENLEYKLSQNVREIDSFEENKVHLELLLERKEDSDSKLIRLKSELDRMLKIREEIHELLKERSSFEVEFNRYEELTKLFEGNKFVEFLALNKIKSISRIASKRLGNISNGRYGITTDKTGSFLIVDNFNGGELRKASTLSGGETFLVSLSLALALSSQIQLKGAAQLEFFFLDEGFGTLDSELLDKVMSSLESLRDKEGMKVGIISHVEELRERVPRKVEVLGPISGLRGSKVKIR